MDGDGRLFTQQESDDNRDCSRNYRAFRKANTLLRTKRADFSAQNLDSNRKFSFLDVEKLIEIAEKVEEGVRISEIKEDFERSEKNKNYRRDAIKGQINSHFQQKRW